MTKIDGRTRRPPAKQIDESLQRLQTDHIDLLQIHEVIRMEDPDRIFAPGGAHGGAAWRRSKAGKLRYIGFTGHKDPIIHLQMLETRRRSTTSASTPCRCRSTSWTRTSAASSRRCCRSSSSEEIGVLGMKPLGGGDIAGEQDGHADRLPALCDEPADLAW